MSQANPVFEKNYSYYLDEIAKVDFGEVKDTLACRVDGDQLVVPFFGREYRVSRSGITDAANRKPGPDASLSRSPAAARSSTMQPPVSASMRWSCCRCSGRRYTCCRPGNGGR